MKTTYSSSSCSVNIAAAVIFCGLVFSHNSVFAQSTDSVPDAFVLLNNEALLKNTLLAHDDTLLDHEKEIRSLKQSISDLHNQLHGHEDRLTKTEKSSHANTKEIEAIQKRIAAIDDELKKRYQARQSESLETTSSGAKKTTATVASLKSNVDNDSVQATSVRESYSVVPASEASLLATFQVASHSTPASLQLLNGDFYIDITDNENNVTRHPVKVVRSRPCSHCVDVVRLHHASLANTVTLSWHPCRKQYLLVNR